MFCSWNFVTLASTFRHDPLWVNLYIWCEVEVKAHYFAHGHAIILAPSVEILPILNWLRTFVKNQLTVFVLISSGALYSVPLIHMSVLPPILHCLDHYLFLQYLRIREWEASNFILYLRKLKCLKWYQSYPILPSCPC